MAGRPADVGSPTPRVRRCLLCLLGGVVVSGSAGASNLRCWGPGLAGLKPPENLPNVQGVSVGYDHSCAWTHAGEVTCWGSNSRGQRDVPTGLAPVAGVAAGGEHTCAWSASGFAVCWGSSSHLQLAVPRSLREVAGVAAGRDHNCAWTRRGLVSCWGDDARGKCEPPANLPPVSAVASGQEHSCALTTSGAVQCWGDNREPAATVPARVPAVSFISAGAGHSCAMAQSGQTICWGSSSALEMSSSATVPGAVGMSTGPGRACVWTRAGLARCRSHGGDEVLPADLPPIQWLILGRGGRNFACAVLANTVVGGPSPTAALLRGSASRRLEATLQDTVIQSAGPLTTTTTFIKLGSGPTLPGAITGSADHNPPPSVDISMDVQAGPTTTRTAITIVNAPNPPQMGAVSLDPPSAVSNNPPTVGSVAPFAAGMELVTTTTTTTRTARTTTATTKTNTKTSVTVTTPATTHTTTRTTATLTKTGTSTTRTVTSRTRTATTATVTATTATVTATTVTATWTTLTSTTATVTAASGPADLAHVVSLQQELDLVSQALASPAAVAIVAQTPGATVAASRVNASVLTVRVDTAGTEAVVTAPPVLFKEVANLTAGLAVLSVAVVEQAVLEKLQDERFQAEQAAEAARDLVLGVLSVNLFSANGTRVPVSGLSEPFLLTLPVNYTPGVECAYLDEEIGQWSNRGVKTIGVAGRHLQCASTHLTLFAGILRGFVDTLTCTTFRIFSLDGIKALGDPGWFFHPAAIAFWVVLSTLLAMFIVAVILDIYRSESPEDRFLIPKQQSFRRAVSDHLETAVSWRSTGSQMTFKSTFSETASAAKPSARAARACFGRCYLCCKRSSAMRDVLDDVVSRWFRFFSEVRDFIEGVWGGICGGEEEAVEHRSCWARLLHLLLSTVLSNSARRQAAASLGLSTEVVTFITEEKGLQHLMVEAATAALPDKAEVSKASRARLEFWLRLHEEVIIRIDKHWSLPAHWCSFPSCAARLFFLSSPLVNVFLGCHFWTCSQRVLFLASELLGSIMVVTMFYQASDAMTGKRSRGECSQAEFPFQQLGRLIAIGLVALLVAYLPVIGLHRGLHGEGPPKKSGFAKSSKPTSMLAPRRLKMFEREGCKEWRRQLQVWRIQDRMVYWLGVFYVIFCSLFVTVFLANVAPKHLDKWAVTGLTSLVEDTILIPLGIGICVPLTSLTMVSAVSYIKGVEKLQLLQEGRQEREERGGNWYQVVLSI